MTTTTITIQGRAVTLGPPTTHQALTLLRLYELIQRKGLHLPTSGSDTRGMVALITGLGTEGWDKIIGLLEDLTSGGSWRETPVHETVSDVVRVAMAWLPVINDYMSGTVAPHFERLAGQVNAAGQAAGQAEG